MKSLGSYGLLVIVVLLGFASLDAASARGTHAAATKGSAKQQACAVKCDAELEDVKADDAEFDDTSSPEELKQIRHACMVVCLGRPVVEQGTAPAARTGPAAQKAQHAGCGNIVGTWNWPNGTVVTFYKNGTAGFAGQSPTGTWVCSGGAIVATYNNGGRDQYKVAPDGNTLSLTTNWVPGTYTAERKSRN